jgi:hypothetical protein
MTAERLIIPGTDGRSGPYDVPPINSGVPRLYALLAVEVAPNKIAYYHLELDHAPDACVIDMERNAPEVTVVGDFLSPIREFGPWHINARISGTVVSDRPDYRPPTRTGSHVPHTLPPGPDHA